MQRLRDLWRQRDIGTFDGSYTVEVAPHGVALLKASEIGIATVQDGQLK